MMLNTGHDHKGLNGQLLFSHAVAGYRDVDMLDICAAIGLAGDGMSATAMLSCFRAES